MATTIKTFSNIGIKSVFTPSVTIQPGETIVTSAQNLSVSGYNRCCWELASDNDSYFYSDLVITGRPESLQVRNMGNTAFTGRIKIRAIYYPAFNLIYL